MTLLRWGPFTGTIPRRAPRFLPEGAAQVASNCKLFSNEIRPYGGTAYVATPIPGTSTRTFKRYEDAGTEYWFAWDSLVQMVEAPIASDVLNRRFYTGDGTPKKTGNDIGIPANAGVLPAASYHMGVLNPYQVPTVDNQIGGATPEETVNYLYTHVTGWGEESGPSAPSADFTAHINRTSLRFTRPTPSFTFADADVTVAADSITETAWEGNSATKIQAYGRVRLTTSGVLPAGLSLATDYWVVPLTDDTFGLAATYALALAGTLVDITAAAGGGTHTITQYTPDGRYNITTINIYRSNTGTDGAEFLFVAALAIDTGTTTQVTDNIADSALGEVLETTDFAEPPTDMIGLGNLPNGMLFGISPAAKQLCLSYPYEPYAWPDTTDYRRTLNFTPVGAGAVGSTVYVGTDGKPYIFSGVEPGAMTGDAENAQQAVVSAASVVETPQGVGWASPYGFYIPGLGVVTSDYFTQDEWSALNPASMVAVAWAGRVYLAYDAADTGEYEVLVFDPREPGARCTTLDQNAKAMYADLANAALYMLLDGQIVQWDADPLNPIEWTYRTHPRRDPFPNNKSIAQIISDFGGGVLANGQLLVDYNTARTFIADWNADLTLYDATGDNSAYNPVLGGAGLAGAGETALAGDLFFDTPPELDQTMTVRVYGDDVLRHTRVVTAQAPFTLPPGYRATEWFLEVTASCRWSLGYLANGRKELGRVP